MVIVRNLIMVATGQYHANWLLFVHPLAHLLGALSATASSQLRGGFRLLERLEERDEQLEAERRRLLYDAQAPSLPPGPRRCRLLYSPPPSLPPGPPSSTAGESMSGYDVELAADQLVQLQGPAATGGPGGGAAEGASAHALSAASGLREALAAALDARWAEVSGASEQGADDAGDEEHTNLKRRRGSATAAPAGKQVKRKEHKSIARTAFAEQLLQKLTAVAKGPDGYVHVSVGTARTRAPPSAWSASSAYRRRS